MKIIIEIGRAICRVLFHTIIRVKVSGVENVPKKGGVIIAANHVTAIDVIFLEYKLKRHIRWMSKAELFEKKLVGWFLRKLGAFPVKRGTLDITAAKTTFELLEKGEVFGIFPQGTRSKDFSNPKKARHGVTKFAVEAGVPVVPVAISGKFKLFGKIYVRYGKPVFFEKKKDGSAYSKNEYTEMAQEMLDGIYDMMEENHGDNKG